jgi:hypothetical protein
MLGDALARLYGGSGQTGSRLRAAHACRAPPSTRALPNGAPSLLSFRRLQETLAEQPGGRVRTSSRPLRSSMARSGSRAYAGRVPFRGGPPCSQGLAGAVLATAPSSPTSRAAGLSAGPSSAGAPGPPHRRRIKATRAEAGNGRGARRKRRARPPARTTRQVGPWKEVTHPSPPATSRRSVR